MDSLGLRGRGERGRKKKKVCGRGRTVERASPNKFFVESDVKILMVSMCEKT